MRKTHFLYNFDILADNLFSFTACSKIAWCVCPLCEHRQGVAFSIHWQQYR